MHSTLFYQIKDIFISIGVIWDKLAPAKETAIEFAYKNINHEPQKRINQYQYSMEYCLAHSGETINERFRNKRTEAIDEQIAAMVELHKTKVPLVLYRGVCNAVFQQMRENAKEFNGADLYERSFLQTSLVKGQENCAEIYLRIYTPIGTKAVYLGNVNDEQFYYEVDIQHGAQLKIISIDKKYINCILTGTN